MVWDRKISPMTRGHECEMARLEPRRARTRTEDCVAPLVARGARIAALHQTSLSRHANKPDLVDEHENRANERDESEEDGCHVMSRLYLFLEDCKHRIRISFCLLELQNRNGPMALDDLRETIDGIDNEILALLEQRATTV